MNTTTPPTHTLDYWRKRARTAAMAIAALENLLIYAANAHVTDQHINTTFTQMEDANLGPWLAYPFESDLDSLLDALYNSPPPHAIITTRPPIIIGTPTTQ